MLDKHFLESFLKINNASAQMPDAEVKDVLSKGGWTASEVEAALALLRSDAGNAQALFMPQTASLGVSFRPETDVSSDQISSLLGVDVEIDPRRVRGHHAAFAGGPAAYRETFIRTATASAIVLLSLGIAASVAMGFFFLLEIGPFRS